MPTGRRLRVRRILPFNGPYGGIEDVEGRETQFRAAFLLGCVVAWSLHPVQIDIAKKVFLPDPDEGQVRKEAERAPERLVRVGTVHVPRVAAATCFPRSRIVMSRPLPIGILMTYPTDPKRLELHDRALTLAREQGISYIDAAIALSKPEAATGTLATDPPPRGSTS